MIYRFDGYVLDTDRAELRSPCSQRPCAISAIVEDARSGPVV